MFVFLIIEIIISALKINLSKYTSLISVQMIQYCLAISILVLSLGIVPQWIKMNKEVKDTCSCFW